MKHTGFLLLTERIDHVSKKTARTQRGKIIIIRLISCVRLRQLPVKLGKLMSLHLIQQRQLTDEIEVGRVGRLGDAASRFRGRG